MELNNKNNSAIRLKAIVQVVILVFLSNMVFADGGLTAYYRVATLKGSITDVSIQVKKVLSAEAFKILGEYNPGKDSTRHIVAFTRQDLIDVALIVEDRGLLAAVLKVGLLKNDAGEIEVSLLNPDYLFYGYLRDHITEEIELQLSKISMDVRITLSQIGTDFEPFGGNTLTDSELKNFRYLVRYPSFDEPVILKTFGSYEEGIETIQKNLKARSGGAIKVFELVFDDKKIAVFGVALSDNEKGEANFLNVLGEKEITALPYEVFLQNNEASILPGRFRFPFFWSHLTMTDLKNIYKVPSDIEYVMRGLTK